jgi:hypothetical protein
VRSSERGLRDGMIAALVAGGENWWRVRRPPRTGELEEALASPGVQIG